MTQPASTPDVPQAPAETAQPAPAPAAAPVAVPAADVPQPASWVDKVRARLDKLIPASARETAYRVVAAVIMGLTATGITDPDKATMWSQLGVATVTLLWALLYAGTSIRAALYAVTGAGGALLMAYGLAKGVDWAVIVASVGQALGVASAAAKTVTAPSEPADS